MKNKRTTQFAMVIFLSIFSILLFGCNADSTFEPEAIENVETVEPDPGTINEVVAEDPEIAIIEAAEEMEEETCKTLRYLGMSKEEIVELYGEPHLIFDVPGPGGDYYVYKDLPISFIFAGQTDVVNNLGLGKGAEIKGIEIGMTLKEIKDVWGNADSKGYDEGFENYGRYPWHAVYMLDGVEHIEVYIFFKESDGPSVQADVFWKSFQR